MYQHDRCMIGRPLDLVRAFRMDTPVRYAVDPWIATVTQG